MKYAILCFTAEELSNANWSPGQDDQVMARIHRVTEDFGKVTYAARLLPATSAVSVRKGKTDPLVVDGPFIESKEHLVGFYVVDCESLEPAIEFARNLMGANRWGSGYEIRAMAIQAIQSGS